MALLENMFSDYTPAAAANPEVTQTRQRQQSGLACDECRRKKLRCNRKSPQCDACARSGSTCTTTNDVGPRGPKKGHVTALRNQIAALEARLGEHEKNNPDVNRPSQNAANEDEHKSDGDSLPQMLPTFSPELTTDFSNTSAWFTPAPIVDAANLLPPLTNPRDCVTDPSSTLMFLPPEHIPIKEHLSPLVCSDLDQLYFDRAHVFAPFLQKARYITWSKQKDKPKQKVCLQYAMWALTASLSSQFHMIRHELYTEARRLLDALEMESQDAYVRRIEQSQAWLLLTIYESMNDQFQRALISAGRAFRLIQLIGLSEVDKQPAAGFQGDWVDKESMRRTFWVAYILDRFISMVDELPLTFNEPQMGILLPAPESNYISGKRATTCFLSELISKADAPGRSPGTLSGVDMSPFAESVVMATICGRALGLQRQPVAECKDQNMTQGLYRQHQSIYELLIERFQLLSKQLSSALGHPDSMSTFLAMTTYMAILMLYETLETLHLGAALPESTIASTKQRSLDAAAELNTLIPTLAQLNYFETHPLTPIPLLLIARFCISHVGLDELYATLMPMILSALRGLTNVNGLARNFLRLLNRHLPSNF